MAFSPITTVQTTLPLEIHDHVKYTQTLKPHFLFGNPADLPIKSLPTKCDIILYYLYLKTYGQNKGGILVNAKHKKLIRELCNKVIAVWEQVFIPHLNFKVIQGKVSNLILKVRTLSKINNSQRSNTQWMTSRKKSFDQLFDICKCKCLKVSFSNKLNPQQLHRDVCQCKAKLSSIKWRFYVDQCTQRTMEIESVRENLLSVRQQNEILSSEEQQKQNKAQTEAYQANTSFEGSQSSDSDFVYCSLCDDAIWSKPRCNQFSNYPKLAAAVDRFGISPHIASVICNAMLKDLGIISPHLTARKIQKIINKYAK